MTSIAPMPSRRRRASRKVLRDKLGDAPNADALERRAGEMHALR